MFDNNFSKLLYITTDEFFFITQHCSSLDPPANSLTVRIKWISNLQGQKSVTESSPSPHRSKKTSIWSSLSETRDSARPGIGLGIYWGVKTRLDSGSIFQDSDRLGLGFFRLDPSLLFTAAGNLKRHIKSIHDGHKDQNCDICSKSFSTKPQLTKHIKGAHNKKKIKD